MSNARPKTPEDVAKLEEMALQLTKITSAMGSRSGEVEYVKLNRKFNRRR